MSQSLIGIVLSFLLLSLLRPQNPVPHLTGDSLTADGARQKTVIYIENSSYEPIAHAKITLAPKGTEPEISGETDSSGNFVCYPPHNDFNLSIESGHSSVSISIRLGKIEENIRVHLSGPETPRNLGVSANLPQDLVNFRAVYNEQPVVGVWISVESGAGITWLCRTNQSGTCSLELPHMNLDLRSTLELHPILGPVIRIRKPLLMSQIRGEVLLEFDRAQVEQRGFPK